MTTPYNGWASTITVQAETTFNAASAQPIYLMRGQVRLTQAPQFAGKEATFDIWRNRIASSFVGKFHQGTIELELGFNPISLLILSTFFELVSTTTLSGTVDDMDAVQILDVAGNPITTAEGELTQLIFRQPRLNQIKSLKIGIDYPAGPHWAYSGVVIDAIGLVVRRNQIPRLSIQFKAASLATPGSAPALGGSATDVTTHTASHLMFRSLLDVVQYGNVFEATFNFSHAKTPTCFASDGTPTKFIYSEASLFQGQIAEYFSSSSPFPAAVLDQNDHVFSAQYGDVDNSGRMMALSWPRINFSDGTPDGIAAGDLAYRTNFVGMHDTALNFSNEPQITLVV